MDVGSIFDISEVYDISVVRVPGFYWDKTRHKHDHLPTILILTLNMAAECIFKMSATLPTPTKYEVPTIESTSIVVGHNESLKSLNQIISSVF
jgi:hypothetical protein